MKCQHCGAADFLSWPELEECGYMHCRQCEKTTPKTNVNEGKTTWDTLQDGTTLQNPKG